MRQLFTFVRRHSRHITLGLVFVVFALSSAFGLASGGQLRYPDEHDYSQLAQSIRSGRGYLDGGGDPTAYRPPGWPLLLSGVYHLWAHPLAGKLANALFYACAAWLLSLLVGRVVPEGRLWVPLLMVLYPVGFYTASTLYPQTLGTLLFVGALLLLEVRKHPTIATTAAGALFGLLVLSIPAFMLVTPLVLAGMWVVNRGEPGLFIRRSALFLLWAVLVVTPWTLRNAHVFGRFVPVSTNSGVNLLLGNSENARPNSGVNVDISRYEEQVEGLGEAEGDARLRRFALDWILDNPGRAAELYVRKVLNYFNFRNQLYVQAEQSRLKDVVMFLSYYPLLCIAILRLAWHERYPITSTEAWLYLLYFGNAFVSAVFFTRIRFRLPFDALLIAIVATSLGLLVRVVNSSYEKGRAVHIWGRGDA